MVVEKIREEYKMTELGEIPVEWEVSNLKSISEFITKGSTPTTYGFEWVKEGILFLKSDCVTDNGFKIGSAMRISKEAHDFMKRSKVKSGDILLSITGNIGRPCIIPDYIEEANINQHVARIRINSLNLNNKFIYHYLCRSEVKKNYEKIKTGLAYPQISLEQVRNTVIPIPTLKEQQKIADIVSIADEKIEIAENLIEKTKELKKGLMQRLLTKGIGHERFKDTEIGKIPEEWNVESLNDISAKYKNSIVDGPFGSNLKTCDYVEEGILVMQSNYITGGKFELRDVRYISENKAKELERSKVKSGDILMAKIGANFGRAEIIPENIKYGILSSNSLKIDLNELIAMNSFYIFVLKSYKKNGTIDKLASTTAQPALSLKAIKNLKVAVPSLNEQKKIASILSSVDEKIDQYESQKDKLQELKKGLMQNLLTGKIRVKV